MSCASSSAAGSTSSCVEHPAAQAQLDSPLAVESRSGQQDFGRVGDPDQPRQHPVRVGVTDDPAPNLHDAVARVGGKEPDVALQRQRQPQPDGVAVDRGDHRLGSVQAGTSIPGRAKARPGFGERVLTVAEVGARTERGRCAGQHNHPDGVVAVAGRGRRRQARRASRRRSRCAAAGRLRVMVATPASTSNRTCGNGGWRGRPRGTSRAGRLHRYDLPQAHRIVAFVCFPL